MLIASYDFWSKCPAALLERISSSCVLLAEDFPQPGNSIYFNISINGLQLIYQALVNDALNINNTINYIYINTFIHKWHLISKWYQMCDIFLM